MTRKSIMFYDPTFKFGNLRPRRWIVVPLVSASRKWVWRLRFTPKKMSLVGQEVERSIVYRKKNKVNLRLWWMVLNHDLRRLNSRHRCSNGSAVYGHRSWSRGPISFKTGWTDVSVNQGFGAGGGVRRKSLSD